MGMCGSSRAPSLKQAGPFTGGRGCGNQRKKSDFRGGCLARPADRGWEECMDGLGRRDLCQLSLRPVSSPSDPHPPPYKRPQLSNHCAVFCS